MTTAVKRVLVGTRSDFEAEIEEAFWVMLRVTRDFGIRKRSKRSRNAVGPVVHPDAIVVTGIRLEIRQRYILGTLDRMDGIEVYPSQTNFMLFKPAMDSKELEVALQKEGIIVRELAGFYMPGYIRVSVGRPNENAAFIEKLGKIVG